jgi:ABC-2 type transport system ATP-binding protein
MIELQSVNKFYGAFQVLRDISFTVNRGEIVGFLGPNGAGKTTTMRILNGFLPATSGRAMVAGHAVDREPLAAKRALGYLPENVSLYNDMTVREYLRFVAEAKKVPSRELRAKLEKVTSQCGLEKVSNRLIGALSKGYRQRVGLAQAIVNDPRVLIMDEPTTGLDPAQIIEIRELISSLAGEHTIILSTHILPEVSAVCKRVIIINEGRIVAEDSLDNLTGGSGRGGSVTVRVENLTPELESRLAALKGVSSVRCAGAAAADGATELLVLAEREADIRRAVAETVVGSGAGLLELRPNRLSLEEIFMQIITRNA